MQEMRQFNKFIRYLGRFTNLEVKIIIF